MLTYLRKHSKGWLAYTAFGAIIVVFVLWGGSSYISREANKVAKIDRTIITTEQYSKAYTDTLKRYQTQFGQALTPEMINRLNLREQVLDELIDQYIIEADAAKMGIGVKDADLQMFISQVPAFQRDGKFDEATYRRYLEYERITPAEFEQRARRDFVKQLFKEVLTENVIVAPQEIEAAFHQISDTYELHYLTVDSATFSGDVQVSQEQVQGFFDANKERYRIPPRITIAAIDFPVTRYLGSTEVTTEEAMDYYDGHKGEFSEPAQVHLRHILIKVPEGADAASLTKKQELAAQIIKEAKDGKDFASLAASYSEDEATAGKGGDMGMLPLNSFHPELGKIVESMKPGDVNGPVMTADGIQIIKLEGKEDAKAIPFDKVAASVVDMLKMQRARIVAHDEAEKAFMEFYEQDKLDLEGYAAKQGMEVRRIGPFSENEKAGIAMSQETVKKAFTFSAGELGEVIETPGGYAVYQVVKKDLSRIPDLEEVVDVVTADAKAQTALERAKEHAQKLATAPMNELVSSNPSSTGKFTRSASAVPKLSMLPKLMDEVDSLGTPKVYESDGRVFIVWIKSKDTVDIRSLDKDQAEGLRKGLLARKKELVLQDYLEQARDEKKGWHDVVIERERLAGSAERVPQDVPPPMDFN
ncbi:MAG TPA: SurA N-terminal domain-containing protein [Deltaproteobacteria bacterium]|jgi:peptidyl-prolyl cis-trans isomerase D|nr:MAG: Peptidyl-prolyl cis-trans isomerase D [Deltaproteobacteria bacterium ADurb.Bin072]HNQ85552.1 SurA N-terminal domain-containing protein [Deltaproteobacteria bacterium]HNS89064.1 SurA N-terminal domain-containing protein [Deltaproteobacteria bacterium]HOA43812.1 SurA N-terminal domain-containing protein [Deltaproteobacteria bacterium]HOC76034.1 SurA N-terminal domain-containing protein [Deltaproteobacteria bacterium]